VDLTEETAIETHGTELDGDKQAVVLAVLAQFLLIPWRERPVPGHLFVGKIA